METNLAIAGTTGQLATLPIVTVIVPCYNEEGAIRDTILALHDALRPLDSYELIVVNDGSSDGTSKILEAIVAEDDKLRVIEHARNRGYGAALKTGIRQASSELIAITDADGTYPNERLAELVELTVSSRADMVVGSRTAKNVTYPFIRKIPKWFLRAYASWIAGTNIPDINSGMRVFRRDLAVRFFNILPDGFSFTTTITLAMLTNFHDVRYVPIGYSARIGKSKIRPIRDTLNFVQLILRTGIYFAPLRVLMPLVFLIAVGFGVSLTYDVVVLRNLTDKTLLLFMSLLNTGMFALLADMIDKRSGR